MPRGKPRLLKQVWIPIEDFKRLQYVSEQTKMPMGRITAKALDNWMDQWGPHNEHNEWFTWANRYAATRKNGSNSAISEVAQGEK